MSVTLNDILAYQALTQRASQAAQAAYQQGQLTNQGENTAVEWAKLAWQKVMDTANQTGMWNGQWSNPQQQWFTGQFGQWYGAGGEPGIGTPTLAAQAQANQLGGLYGQYFAPGTAPNQGTATAGQTAQAAQTAQNQAQLTGYLQNTGTGNIVADAWNMLDAGTQQQYLQTSPGGNDAQEAMQRYYQNLQTAVYNRAREAGQTVTPQTMNDYVYGGWNTQGQQTLQGQQQQFQQGFNVWQEAARQQQANQQTALNYLNLMSNLRGPADWAKYQQVLGSTPQGMKDLVSAAMGQYVPGGGATTGVQPTAASLQSLQGQIAGTGTAAEASGGGTNVFGNLPAPNQVAAQSWKNLAPTQQQLLLGGWESQGWNKDDVAALMNQSLPKYATNMASAGTWRLQ